MNKIKGKSLAIIVLLVFFGILLMTIAATEAQSNAKKDVISLGSTKYVVDFEKDRVTQYKPKNKKPLIVVFIIGLGLTTAGIVFFGIEWAKSSHSKESQ